MTHARETTEAREWMERAACAQIGGDLWYADEGQANYRKEAKEICAGCPVQTECLTYALEVEAADPRTSFRYGIWSGTTPNQRHELAKKRSA